MLQIAADAVCEGTTSGGASSWERGFSGEHGAAKLQRFAIHSVECQAISSSSTYMIGKAHSIKPSTNRYFCAVDAPLRTHSGTTSRAGVTLPSASTAADRGAAFSNRAMSASGVRRSMRCRFHATTADISSDRYTPSDEHDTASSTALSVEMAKVVHAALIMSGKKTTRSGRAGYFP